MNPLECSSEEISGRARIQENTLVYLGRAVRLLELQQNPFFPIGFEQPSKYWRKTPWYDFTKNLVFRTDEIVAEDFQIRC